MSLGEFNLINKYFTAHDSGEGIALGIGDDCALLSIPQDCTLAITTDTLNEGIHFFKNTSPYYLGYKSLLVNVSDLAAMGARPYCFTLSVTLPSDDEEFLSGFSRGLFELADKLNMPLIGGNTSKGPLSVTISAYGLVKNGRCMRRDRAKSGDGIYVTGELGLSALAVDLGYGKIDLGENAFSELYKKSMLIPDRTAFACDLTEICECAMDISDGLSGDLQHILESSHAGAQINLEALPAAKELLSYNLDEEYIDRLCLFGGGDYELLFTLSDDKYEQLMKLSAKHKIKVSKVGYIKNSQLSYIKRGKICNYLENSFQHFKK